MRVILLLAAILLSSTASAETVVERYAPLAGSWKVDLRVALTDAPYAQPMVLTVAEDGSLTGSFYNSEILAGRVGRGQDRKCVAFRTTDGKGFYHSSACLVEGKMIGQTWSEGRNFVLPWTAER